MTEGWFERELREANEASRRSRIKLQTSELSSRARRDLEKPMYYEEAVRMFHDKLDVSRPQKMHTGYRPDLAIIGQQLVDASQRLEPLVSSEDARWLRAHLLLEELGECLLGMATGDELAAFDGLIDLLYVLTGTAVQFDWPMDAGFQEVHRSNMTKKRKSDDPGRVRNKGDEFVPPNLQRVLDCTQKGE